MLSEAKHLMKGNIGPMLLWGIWSFISVDEILRCTQDDSDSKDSSDLPRLTCPVFCAQNFLVDLADGGEWQAVDELDLLGRVRAALAVLDVLHQRFGRWSRARLDDD